MAIDAVEALARVPLLSGIDRKHLERLTKSFRERTFDEGMPVTREGESGAGFFVILDGSATVSVGGETKATVGAGDAIGEMALIDDGPRTATVIAATDMRCLVLAPWEFRAFVEDHPSLAWQLLQTLAQRLRAAQA